MTRVHYGVKDELLELVTLNGVGRVRARSLYRKGFISLASLKEASVTNIAGIIGIGDLLAQRIKSQVDPLYMPEKKIKELERASKDGTSEQEPVRQGQTRLFDF
jgi:helicase